MIPRVTSRTRQPTTKPKTYLPGTWGRPRPGVPQVAGSTPNYTPPTPSQPSQTSLPSTPAADPRDPQFFNDIAKLNQYYTSQKANLTASGAELARSLVKNNQFLDEALPKDRLKAKQGANDAGLLYSGALGKNLGEIETGYARRKSDLQTDYANKRTAILGQLSDLEGNYGPQGLMRNDALLQGIGRAASMDQILGAGAGGGASTQAPAAAANLPFTTRAGTSKSGVPGVWHIYPGGRKVFVAKR